MSLGTECIEDTCEFYCNIARTDNDDFFRLFCEFEETIRVDTIRGSRDFRIRRSSRTTPNSQDDMVRLELVRRLVILRHFDSVRILNTSPSLVTFDIFPLQVPIVNTIDHLDIVFSLRNEIVPVERRDLVVVLSVTVVSSSYETVSKICSMPHKLCIYES